MPPRALHIFVIHQHLLNKLMIHDVVARIESRCASKTKHYVLTIKYILIVLEKCIRAEALTQFVPRNSK